MVRREMERAPGDGRKTLWVRDNFARDVDRETGERRNPDAVAYEQVVWDLFFENGIKINRGFPHYSHWRRGDVGIGSQDNGDEIFVERERKIATEAGANLPKEYSWRQMLKTDRPIVAKMENEHQGEGKFLVRTHEDKLRLAAIMKLTQAELISIYNDRDSQSQKRRMQEIFEKLERNDTSGPEFIQGQYRYLRLQEYIETPSTRYTSFRVLTDAFGVIHGVLLLYSNDEKSSDELQTSIGTSEKVKIYERYLLDPNSPFCIRSTPFVSNFTRSGNQINFMYPQSPRDQTEAKLRHDLLVAHGFDPDNPQLPQHIMELARTLGIMHGKEDIRTGLDFVMDKETGEYYLLEMNIGPQVDPEDIGLSSRELNSDDADIILLLRILEEMKAA